MSSRAPHHDPGDQVGAFRLEHLLGRGAAAEVWQVVEEGQLGFTKRMALKLLRPPPGELQEQTEALINEARVCGRMKHEGVVDVYRVGETEGEIFIAMELVDGPDLDSLLSGLRRRGIELPVPAALDIAIQLAEALAHAHGACDDEGSSLQIIHRDLKPSNVLVDRSGRIKITDWGLVKSRLNVDSTTRGVVKGTPGYIAPEVWGGSRSFLPAVDLFAVGVILYEALVGKRLFRGRNLGKIADQVARRKSTEEAEDVKERCAPAQAIVEKLLRRVPESRYQSAEDVLSQLAPVRETYPPNDDLKAFIGSHGPLVEEIIEQARKAQEKDGRYGSAAQQARGHSKYGPHEPDDLELSGVVENDGPARLQDPGRGDGWEFWEDGSGVGAGGDAPHLGDAEGTWVGVDAEDEVLVDDAPGGIPVAPTANNAPSLKRAMGRSSPGATDGPATDGMSSEPVDDPHPNAQPESGEEESVSDVVTETGIEAVDDEDYDAPVVPADVADSVNESLQPEALASEVQNAGLSDSKVSSVDVEQVRRVARAAELAGPENTMRSVPEDKVPTAPVDKTAVSVKAVDQPRATSRKPRRRRSIQRARIRRLRTLVAVSVALGGTILLLVGLVLTLAV